MEIDVLRLWERLERLGAVRWQVDGSRLDMLEQVIAMVEQSEQASAFLWSNESLAWQEERRTVCGEWMFLLADRIEAVR